MRIERINKGTEDFRASINFTVGFSFSTQKCYHQKSIIELLGEFISIPGGNTLEC